MLPIKVPPLGESIVEATVSRWLKKEGDVVAAGDTLVDLETDKITVEVPALKPGVLTKRSKAEGEVVHVDDVLGELDETAVPAAVGATAGASSAAAPSPASPPSAPAPATPAPRASSPVPAGSPSSETVKSSPAARKIADERGIHWNSIRRSAELVKYVAENSPRGQGNFNFAITAMLKPYTPFYPGSYHNGSGRQFAFGFETANLVRDVFAKDKGNVEAAIPDLTAALTVHAKVADSVGNEVEAATGWTYLGLDPAATALGDVSIAGAIEAFTGARFGSSGTLTAARIITTAEKAIPVRQVGYSGLMLPVLEDKLLAQRWAESTYDVDSLLAYSSVCATGLDTVPLPGDISVEQIERIFSDIASLAFKWNKPLAGRILPVKGKKAGDKTDFQDPYLFNTTLRSLP
jgi:hypothetical protein